MGELPLMRPGGIELTDRALEIYPLDAGAKVLDIGCGSGAALQHMRNMHGLDAVGVDKAAEASGRVAMDDDKHDVKAANVIKCVAEQLCFGDESMDGVFFECSLSKTDDMEKALSEAYRVLKQGGVLFICDMYARGVEQQFDGDLGRLMKMPVIKRAMADGGFSEYCWEDRSEILPAYFAQLIFDMGDEAYGQLGADKADLKSARCGYYQAVYRKDARCGVSPMRRWISDITGLGQALNADTLHKWQLDMAWASVVRAKENSRFFAGHLKDVDTANKPEGDWLAALPFTTPEMVMEHGAEMLCVPLSEVARIRTMFTSGSTGEAKRIWFSDNDLERTVDFFSVGMQPLVRQGGRVGIMMSDGKPGSIADLLKRGLERFGAEGLIYGNVADYADAAQAVEGAECLVGMAAEMYRLSMLYPGLRPKTVLLSADYVALPIMQALERQWGCKVYTHYGVTETCYGLAVQCSSREYQHIRNADYIIEIIDPATGDRVVPGMPGEVVLTSLRNEALPLIRYRIRDIASLSIADCPCGCGLPRLGRVLGRREYLEGGISIHRLDDVMFSLPGLLSYSAALEGDVLRLVVEGGSVDTSILQERLNCDVRVGYSAENQFKTGKRKLESI